MYLANTTVCYQIIKTLPSQFFSTGTLFRIRNINVAFRRVQTPILNALHVITSDVLCCSGIFSGRGSRQYTLHGSTVRVRRRRGRAYVDGVHVSECDLVVKGGVIHAVNSLLPRSPYMRRSSRRGYRSRKRSHISKKWTTHAVLSRRMSWCGTPD